MKLTIISPFYNESENVHFFYNELLETLLQLDLDYEIICIDDGSDDDTLAQLQSIAKQDENITILSLSRNFGHQNALTAGLDNAQGDAAIVMDSDLQHPPSLIPRMLELYKGGADIVYTVRTSGKNERLLKRIASEGFYRLFKRFADVEVIPGSADFRLMSQDVVDTLRNMRETHRYLRGMVPWTGWTSATLPYEQPQRRSGQASYTLRKSFKLARHGLFSFSTIPLELITWTGLFLSILGSIYLLYILIISLLGIAFQGWASTISAVLVLGGIQMLSLGVVAQYVGMIFEEVKGRPLYVIKSLQWSKIRKNKNTDHDQE